MIPIKYQKSVEELILSSIEAKRKCGVYFLFKDNIVVYVGQSVSVIARVENHTTEKYKDFDRWAYIPCHKDNLNDFEAFYIVKFKPKYNSGRLPSNNLYEATWRNGRGELTIRVKDYDATNERKGWYHLCAITTEKSPYIFKFLFYSRHPSRHMRDLVRDVSKKVATSKFEKWLKAHIDKGGKVKHKIILYCSDCAEAKKERKDLYMIISMADDSRHSILNSYSRL